MGDQGLEHQRALLDQPTLKVNLKMRELSLKEIQEMVKAARANLASDQ